MYCFMLLVVNMYAQDCTLGDAQILYASMDPGGGWGGGRELIDMS